MRIGVAGSGNVGGTLGTGWARAGHTVTFGSRNPDSQEMTGLVARAGSNARAATIVEAVASSDVVLLATPWPATRTVLQAAGSLAGKVLIDSTNPLLADLSGIELGTTTSGAEQVALWAPGARVVKAFNSVGSNVMANPRFGDRAAAMFYCGDDKEAKVAVHRLAADLGFDPHDAGPLTQARVLEPLALLWVSLAFARGYGREFAFQLMRR